MGELDAHAVADLPDIPPSEVEWEDLLYRLELMTRALRVALEEVSVESRSARHVLRRLAEREESVRRLLEAAAGVEAENGRHSPARLGDELDGAAAADQFLRYRARNFAMLQRRGVDVWQWRVVIPGGAIGVYPLLVWLARGDIAELAALRRLVAPEGSAC